MKLDDPTAYPVLSPEAVQRIRDQWLSETLTHPPGRRLWITVREPVPPIVDRDPGDEEPLVKIHYCDLFFGEPTECQVCFSLWSAARRLYSRRPTHCSNCNSEFDRPLVLREFTREELYGR